MYKAKALALYRQTKYRWFFILVHQNTKVYVF
jgi:hypothetical protein